MRTLSRTRKVTIKAALSIIQAAWISPSRRLNKLQPTTAQIQTLTMRLNKTICSRTPIALRVKILNPNLEQALSLSCHNHKVKTHRTYKENQDKNHWRTMQQMQDAQARKDTAIPQP